MKKIEFFKVEGEKINRIRRHCPKCGPAVFLAEHKNRYSCGKCGYTEFRGGGKKEPKETKQTQDISEETKEKESDTETKSSADFSNVETTESDNPIKKEPEEKENKDKNKIDDSEKTM